MFEKKLVPFFVCVALVSTGCRGEEILGQSEFTLLWLIASFLAFALIGGVLTHLRRKTQIDNWDLRTSPDEPETRNILRSTVAAWIILGIVFAVVNLKLDIDPSQALKNIGFWIVGSLLGSLVSLVVGLNTAEPRRYAADREDA